jgi:hypothetical protein
MEHLPGRKSVILFSEGIASAGWLQDNRRERFLRLMARANRSHVAFYTFDAAGLRIASTVAAVDAAPYVWLQMMAEETGGAFVDSTNDLTTGVDRVTADLHQYYLLGYVSPKAPDDKYRTITVKVNERDVTVLARKGYRASRGPDLAVVKPAEVAPLLLLEQAQPAAAFPFRISMLQTLTPVSGKTVLLARVPLNSLTFTSNAEGAPSSARLTVVARVKNERQDVIEYAAQTYDLTGQADDAAGGAGDILFYHEAPLPPGTHSLEVAAFDANGQRGSVRRSMLAVPREESKSLRASSLIVVQKMQRRPAVSVTPESSMQALQFGDSLLVPNLGEPVAHRSDLTFAFEAVTDRARSTEAIVTILREGTAIASEPLVLPTPDSSGAIRYVGHIPIESLAPSTYQLTVTLRQDAVTVTRSVALTVQAMNP